MLLATWNLNNRVGKTRFRPEAAAAAIALAADTIVFTEYYPQGHHEQFSATLADAGWTYQIQSADTGEKANRILTVSRLPLEPGEVVLPTFDKQFPANILSTFLPTVGLHVLGLRIPTYESNISLLAGSCWEWLESAAACSKDKPAVIIGDLNVRPTPNRSKGDNYFQRILNNGWTRASPDSGHSFFGHQGARSEIDHLLATDKCVISGAKYLTQAGEITLVRENVSKQSGLPVPSALSDHAALIVDIAVLSSVYR